MAQEPFLQLPSCSEQSLHMSSPKDSGWGNSDPDTAQGQVPQPGWVALQPRPAGTGTILTRGMLLGVLALPSFPAQCKARFCRDTIWLWLLCHNGALWDFSSFPFHFGDKESFSQPLSCRCSIGNNNSSRDFQGYFLALC